MKKTENFVANFVNVKYMNIFWMLTCYNKMILFYSYIIDSNLLKGKLLFFVKIIFQNSML